MVTPQFPQIKLPYLTQDQVYFHANSGLIVSNKAHYRLTGVLQLKLVLRTRSF
jgi:hypothetical protein